MCARSDRTWGWLIAQLCVRFSRTVRSSALQLASLLGRLHRAGLANGWQRRNSAEVYRPRSCFRWRTLTATLVRHRAGSRGHVWLGCCCSQDTGRNQSRSGTINPERAEGRGYLKDGVGRSCIIRSDDDIGIIGTIDSEEARQTPR